MYGVVLDGNGAVDERATGARREEIRAERIGGKPSKDLIEPIGVGISLRRADGEWHCASCDESLGDESGNWREGATLLERPIVERYAELGMQVRDRKEEPTVMVREHFCPSCAMSLGVDVATSDVGPLAAPTGLQAAVTAG